MPMRRRARYRTSARFYDLISAEWPVYRAGRVAAIDLMALRPGHRVLDIGCGTGLNFPLVQDRIGPTGSITGVDASAQMLAQAQRRTRAAGWGNVRLIEADATTLDARALGLAGDFDAVISTYAVSLMANWRVWTPLARLACLLGGSDIGAHPWTAIEAALTDVHRVSPRGGHIQVRVGSVPEITTGPG